MAMTAKRMEPRHGWAKATRDGRPPSSARGTLSVENEEKNERYTPMAIIEYIQDFFGEIDLDPCADRKCRVPARHHFFPPGAGVYLGGGLAKRWGGRVFVNPPYSPSFLLRAWILKGREEFARNLQAGKSEHEQIWLLPAAGDTKWSRMLVDPGSSQDLAMCEVAGRLEFIRGTVDTGIERGPMGAGARFGTRLVYLGLRPTKFCDHFAQLGPTWIRR